MHVSALADSAGVLFGVSGLVLAGALFVFRAGTVVDELTGEHDKVRRLGKRLPDGGLIWSFRVIGTFLVLIGISFGYVFIRPSASISSVASVVLILSVLVFIGAGSVAMILRPRAFVVGMNPTLEVVDSYLSDEWTERIIRGFGAFVFLSSLFMLYLLFVTT